MKRKTQIRYTTASVARAANIKRVIEELRVKMLSSIDIQVMLGFSGSGVRKYLDEMKDALIIEIGWKRPSKEGIVLSPKYKLCTDPDVETRIANYLVRLDAPEILSADVREQQRIDRKKNKLEGDPTRHFHLMSDDAPFQVKFRKQPVKRDPFQALFFGEKGTAKP